MDITDVFGSSAVSIAVTPTKAYLASYTTPDTAEHDTGLSLSVPNGHQFGCTFNINFHGSTNTVTLRLYLGANVVQTLVITSSGSVDSVSNIFINNTGSSATAKLTAQASVNSGQTINLGNLVEGSFVSSNIASLSKWGQASSIVWQFAGQSGGSSVTAIGIGGSQTTSQTTAVTDNHTSSNNLSLLAGAFNTTIGQTGFNVLVSCLVAWDFTGKYVVL